ncbi:MAG: SAM-dependent methyltransferase [Actinomycetota bacterium]
MSARLQEIIADRIREQGPIGFDEYMRAALYDPEDGFFSRAPVGRHFVTSAHVSPVFGALLTRALREAWNALGRPEPFIVAEVGAGDGTLARRILEVAATDAPFAAAVRYLTVEQDAAARAGLERAGLPALEALPQEPFTGCLIANELLDNLPFRLARARDGRTVEVRVGLAGNDLMEVEVAAPDDLARALDPPLRPGEERPVSTTAAAFVEDVAGALGRGYVFVFDYGFAFGEVPEPVRGYREHRLVTDLLADPGATDITGPVDFAALCRTAQGFGLEVHGLVTQREALMALGYRRLLDDMRAEQKSLEDTGRWREGIAMYSARGQASMLVAPDGLGALKLAVLATPGLPVPSAAG